MEGKVQREGDAKESRGVIGRGWGSSWEDQRGREEKERPIDGGDGDRELQYTITVSMEGLIRRGSLASR